MDAVLDLLHVVLKELGIPMFVLEAKLLGPKFLKCLRLCLRLLKQMIKDNSALKLILSQHTLFLMEMLGSPLQPASTLMEMYQNNLDLLQGVTIQNVTAVLTAIRVHGKKARFVAFLSAFCTCDGNPVSMNQNTIVNELLDKHFELLCKVFQKYCSHAKPCKPTAAAALSDWAWCMFNDWSGVVYG